MQKVSNQFCRKEKRIIRLSCLALTEAIKADHGFNVESKPIRDLVGILSEYDAVSRRNFLQFITGSPKLPIGGMFIYYVPKFLILIY